MRVGGRAPPHRRVEVLEALVGDERGDLRAEPARERVLVQHEHAPGLAHRLGDDLAVPRRDRAQVDDLDARVGPELLRGELRAVHGRAPRDDRDAIAARHVRAAAERQHPVGRRHRIAAVALPVQVLVLEEQHRVFASERGAQQPGGVTRPRRERDQQAGHVGEDRLAALAVPDRAALEVAADRDAHDHRAA